MGFSISRIFESFTSEKEARILMLGLDAAGKSTIVHKMKFNESVSTIPTIGFNVDTIKFGKLSFNIWDIGGQGQLRVLWKHYFPNTDGLIYIVDSADTSRIEESKQELFRLLEDEDLRGIPVLVFANKLDLGINSVNSVADKMGLRDIKGREWHIQGASALLGNGLYEGFDWLAKTLKKAPKR